MEWKSIKTILDNAAHGKECSFTGRIKTSRKHKNTLFFDLVDHTGKVQLVIEKTDNPEQYAELSNLPIGSYISASGGLVADKHDNPEIKVNQIQIIAKSNLNIISPWSINGADPQSGDQVFSFPEIYVSNPQRAAILKIKHDFTVSTHQYFQNNGFILVDPPVLTDKILYSKDNVITAKVHNETVYLSQCATFELEPLAMAFGKVYTISPAFRNEPSGSKRHLAEYTHVKAEMLLCDIDELMKLAGDSLFYAITQMQKISKDELKLLGVDLNTKELHPNKHEHIRYDEAIKLANAKGSTTTWGEGLKRRDEIILTEHFNNKYVWVHFPPFISEGFPYKRLPQNDKLSMTCDLIAPHGAGEIVGAAEKIVSAEELIKNLIEKGQKENIRHYWTYIALREYGMPPHGGIGASPERIIYGLLGLDHIRLTKPWPRYPGRKIITPQDQDLKTFDNPTLIELIKKYDLK